MILFVGTVLYSTFVQYRTVHMPPRKEESAGSQPTAAGSQPTAAGSLEGATGTASDRSEDNPGADFILWEYEFESDSEDDNIMAHHRIAPWYYGLLSRAWLEELWTWEDNDFEEFRRRLRHAFIIGEIQMHTPIMEMNSNRNRERRKKYLEEVSMWLMNRYCLRRRQQHPNFIPHLPDTTVVSHGGYALRIPHQPLQPLDL